jgi:hypothetical protein
VTVELPRLVSVGHVDADEVGPLHVARLHLEALGRRIPAMQEQVVPVGVGERGSVTDTGIERVHCELDAVALQRRPRVGDVGDPQGDRAAEGRERDREVARLVLDPAVARPGVPHEPKDTAVEVLRPLQITDGLRDEVDVLSLDQPTEPSIWSWISRFISTAYSRGSSFVIGSTKPDTIIAEASASESPRDIR